MSLRRARRPLSLASSAVVVAAGGAAGAVVGTVVGDAAPSEASESNSECRQAQGGGHLHWLLEAAQIGDGYFARGATQHYGAPSCTVNVNAVNLLRIRNRVYFNNYNSGQMNVLCAQQTSFVTGPSSDNVLARNFNWSSCGTDKKYYNSALLGHRINTGAMWFDRAKNSGEKAY